MAGQLEVYILFNLLNSCQAMVNLLSTWRDHSKPKNADIIACPGIERARLETHANRLQIGVKLRGSRFSTEWGIVVPTSC